MGFTDKIPVSCGGKVVNLGPAFPPEEGGVRGEELGAASNSGKRTESNTAEAKVFQRDMIGGVSFGKLTSDLDQTRCQTMTI